ncbi:MAG: TolC family protein, partial [Woeseiaceae bacterium]
MNKVTGFKCLTLILALATPALLNAASLLEVYQQALQSDPLIHEAEARRLAALEALPQARGALFPQIDANGSWQTRSGSGSTLQFADDGSVGVVSVKSTTETQGWNVGLRQTLFRWDQIVGLKRAGKIVAKAEADREAAQQDLIIRVSARYFEVLAAEDRLTSIHADRLAIARQLEQAKQRFEVGLIAITDVQESQAAYDISVASEIQAKRELATARNFLREITGEYVFALSAPGEKFPLPNPNPADQQSWIDLAMGQNL